MKLKTKERLYFLWCYFGGVVVGTIVLFGIIEDIKIINSIFALIELCGALFLFALFCFLFKIRILKK